MRKSPTKHIVKSHLRQDGKTHVKSYLRGHGTTSQTHMAKPTFNKPEGYTVKLIYPDKTPEKIEVIATTYQHAIDEAFKLKTNPRLPEEIIVTDPSLKEVIHWAGAHAQQVGKIAAQKSLEYGKKAAIAAGHYAKKEIKSYANDARVRTLLGQAYSPDHRVAALARTKLRTEYPDVYNVTDFAQSAQNQNESRLDQLVKQAYSDNRGTANLARMRLRKEYPDTYATMDFTTPVSSTGNLGTHYRRYFEEESSPGETKSQEPDFVRRARARGV